MAAGSVEMVPLPLAVCDWPPLLCACSLPLIVPLLDWLDCSR